MTKLSYFLHGTFWTGWRRWLTWVVCISLLLMLGAFRVGTDAQFSLASLSLFPVLFIAWLGGRRNGLLMALFATTLWAIGDFSAEAKFSAAWVPWANTVTHFMTYYLVAVLTAQVRLHFVKEHEQATHDSLTGLINSGAFLEAGATEVERARRYAHPLSVIFLDLDNFKQLNDSRGHDAGDAALRATAQALQSSLRSNDRVARLGGDEFAVMLPEAQYDESVETGHKICAAVNAALREFAPVTASIGVAWFENADRAFPEMLKSADELMYEVKMSGKGKICSRHINSMSRLS
jgi:diguanylate cyclase (GGDEF)-like protein